MFRILLPCLLAGAIAAAELPSGLFVATAPPDAVDVIAARTAPKPGSTITITGVVGGRLKPFVDGRAIFTVIDRSLICSTGCGSTWSGCGLPPEQLRGGVATVQVADASGKPLTTTLEGANGLEAGSSVVINGTIAAGSNDKALLINASAIHLTTPPAAAPH